jgi:hypothetical protein
VRVRLSGLINGRNQFHSWGFPQASHSGPSLCRTVETIGFECGLKPLGANNIGNGSKSCSHSARVAVQVCSSERVAVQVCSSERVAVQVCSSERVAVKVCSSERVAIQVCSSERVAVQACSSERGTVQACFSDRVAATGSKSCLLRRHQRQLSDFRESLRRPIRQEDWLALKVPKCEIFDRSDFNDFYTIKSLWEGDCGVKI